MVIDVNPLQLSNAQSPIDVTLLGIIVFLHPSINLLSLSIIALQLLRESYLGLSASTVIDLRLLQLENPGPGLIIVVTFLGIIIEVKLLQPMNILDIDNQ